MDLNDFRYKVSRMSPLKRAFVSAALGIPAFGIVLGASLLAPGMGTIASLAVSLGGSILVSSYSDPSRGSFNVLGLHMSRDSLLNIGAFFGSYIFAAPKVVGAALGLMLASASPSGPEQGATQFSFDPQAPTTIEQPQIQAPTIS